jgi:PAS domain S-box-containing protein
MDARTTAFIAPSPETLRGTRRSYFSGKLRVPLMPLSVPEPESEKGRAGERAAEAERQLAWLTGIVEQIPLAFVVAEAPSGRVLMWNEAMGRLLSGPVPEVENFEAYPTAFWFHNDGREVELDNMPLARAARHGEFVKAELFEFVTQDGSRTLVELSASPVRGEDGSILAAIGAFRDVGARERLETVEREFVANAAHELQTPVAAIANAVEALQSGAKDDPEQRDRFLTHLQREADRLGRLSNALLVLARAERGGEPPRLVLLRLDALLREAAEHVQPITGVEVVVECPSHVGVLTHQDLFLQVLGNLGANAARNTESGRITLAGRLVGNMRVVVEVSDTGKGIPLEHQEHVFRRFYRTDSDSAGSGLGLAIASQAAGALGGRLELASTPDVGTTLTLNLPGAKLIS